MSEVKDIDVERILKWAGFRPATQQEYSPGSYPQPDMAKRGWGWRYPNSRIEWYLPDIRNSMDACMEYLEPVLFAKGYRYLLLRLSDGQHLARVLGKKYTEAVEDKPAMAFSKAVDKFIDSEKEQNENTRQA